LCIKPVLYFRRSAHEQLVLRAQVRCNQLQVVEGCFFSHLRSTKAHHVAPSIRPVIPAVIPSSATAATAAPAEERGKLYLVDSCGGAQLLQAAQHAKKTGAMQLSFLDAKTTAVLVGRAHQQSLD